MIYGELAHAKALVTSDQRNAYNKLFAEHNDMEMSSHSLS